METNKDKVSYLIGREIAGNLIDQSLDLNTEFLFKGIESRLSGEDSTLSQEESGKVMNEFQRKLGEKLDAERKAVAEKNKKAGEDFLAENSKKDGIESTDSGIQYRIIHAGTGQKPERSSTVETHYEGTLIDGEVFDSSVKRGQTAIFPVSGVIQGWQEILQLMPEGSKWEVFIPWNLAYGETGSPPQIGPYSALIFTIELISIK